MALLCVAAGLFLFRDRILWALGSALVNDQAPEKADMIVVLAGDLSGHRIEKAVELLNAGYAPKMLVSGPLPVYGVREATLATRYAIEKGAPPDRIVTLIRDDLSTSDEARDIVPELRALGVHKYLIVTSPSHTARSGRIFRRTAPDLTERTVAASDPHWCRGYWWKGRECRKTWLLEATKSVTDPFGM
jgi:uncharacterized SAM-binding protein YcdF (DUF218 family)